MNKFSLKILRQAPAKSYSGFSSLCLISRSKFSTSSSNAPPPSDSKMKYTEKYKLSSDEVKNILRKPKSKPNILVGTQIETPDYKANYEKSIEEQLGTSRFNTVKTFNELLAESNKIEKVNTSIKPSDRADVKYYKYDLPIPNIDPEIEGLDDIFERENRKRITPNQNVWALLNLDKESDYSSYEKGVQAKFNFEKDMYGDVEEFGAIREAQIDQWGNDIVPMNKISDEKYMANLRECFTININMPGTLENEDPNKFIKNLRPVEDFRHTPLIPISDKHMSDFKKKQEAYHRSGLYFEIKKDSLFNYGLFVTFCILAYNLLSFLMDKEEEMEVNYERLKIKRIETS